jgi:predicted PurR-regulated permease PerM
MIRGRLRRRGPEGRGGRPDDVGVIEIDAAELSGLVATPRWLRDVGLTAWLLVGVLVFVVGVVWLLLLTQVIVLPLLTAAVIASVASPVVHALNRRGVSRWLGTALVLLAIVALGIGLVLVVIAGITSQSAGIADQLAGAGNTVEGWLKDLGVSASAAADAGDDADSSISSAFSSLIEGLGAGIAALSALVFFLGLTVLSLFFLLKDGPEIRSWVERKLPAPTPVVHLATQRVLESLRGYFLGVTIVAAFNGVVVGLGALVLGVPLAGTIAVVTFVAAYVPYLGAWTAGAFAVLLALGGAGVEEAGAMVVVVLLANGLLQQLIQPFAYGSALGIHPLAVLIVTLAGGALFGAVGLILAAPLTAAVTRIVADLAAARELEQGESAAGVEPAAEATPG